jgi:hypothetical protein
MIKPQQAAPMGRKYRVSSESAWPLREQHKRQDVCRERRKEQEQEQSK